MNTTIKIRKKNGQLQDFDFTKIVDAVNKSAERVNIEIDEDFKSLLMNKVLDRIKDLDIIPVQEMHEIVQESLKYINNSVYKEYMSYRDYKKRFTKVFENLLEASNRIIYSGDKENANKNSLLISTKKGLLVNELSKNIMLEYELPKDSAQAHINGDIYIHDLGDRLFKAINCCLFDMANLLRGGFTLNGVQYTEPTSAESFMRVFSDIVLEASSQQYGGFTVPEIDTVGEPYVKKALSKSRKYYAEQLGELVSKEKINELAEKYVERALEQGFQAVETRLNTISNSNTQTPFVTFTFGLNTTKEGRMISKAILKNRLKGLGKQKLTPVFPKLVFLHRNGINGQEGDPNYDLYEMSLECMLTRMYPDQLSLNAGYLGEIFDKYGLAISPMGCVDGQEIITYKINNNLYVEAFERMWDRLSQIFEIKEQDAKDNFYIDLENVQIYDTKNGFVKVKRLIKNKDKGDWVRVKFSNGRSLLATSDHPLPIINKGRTYIRDLKVGDKIQINSTQYSENTINYDEDKAWLLGVLLCDSSYDHQVTTSLAYVGEDDIIARYITIFQQVYNLPVTIKLQERGERGYYKDLTVKNSSNVQKELINLFGGLQKNKRQIPNEVFSWNREAKLSFLAGMIDSDGYINGTTHGGSVVQLGSTNKELALQTMALAQALGFPAKAYLNHYTSKNKNKLRYRIEFPTTIELLKYITCQKKIDNFTKEPNKYYNTYAEVTSIEFLGELGKYSYDVTTESDYFEVSGVYSHNCRAYLSPYFPPNSDKPIFIGRANCGAVTLNTVRYAIEAKGDKEKYFKLLDENFEKAVKVHLYTYNEMKNVKASTNPLFFCEGGCHIKLKPNDTIEEAIKTFTWSFGYIGLDEASLLMIGKQIHEDNSFAIEVLQHLNELIDKAKEKYGLLFALYGTPAESLCYTFRNMDYKKYGEIKGVTDKEYYMNSFHVDVKAKINPIKKQNIELPMFNLSKGGRIHYSEFPHTKNKKAIKQVIDEGMKKGFYEGINIELDCCDDCYAQGEFKSHVCPECGSDNITEVCRVCGYLGYKKLNKDTRLNIGKYAETEDRVDHFGIEVSANE